MSEKFDFFSYTESELKGILVKKGFPSYRAAQIYRWVYAKHVFKTEDMSDISKSEREDIAQIVNFDIEPPVKKVISNIDGTIKYAFSCSGEIVESVYMPGKERTTVCLSSQTGCALKCRFCATGLFAGRNMTMSEIIRQFMHMQKESEKRITNVVFMGMGEPMYNLENIFRVIKIMNDSAGIGIGARRITVSTAGITEGIGAIADFPLQVKLAVSLNSAIQAKREKLMPIALKYSISDLRRSLASYQKKKKRKITFEYILLAGVNDGEDDIKELKKFLSEFDCKLNIIPYNGASGEYGEPGEKTVERFKNSFSYMNDSVSVRMSRGRDIAGACGQLKGEMVGSQE